ncbi:MAG: hypothetical protein N3D84_02155 [Candidatus Woesearchaeota archaeon]|nr:hypothetical protein [Candidatus Woesearchaeota archaeon]
MAIEFKRKLYKRGSSFETTIPMPMLFALDLSKKHNVVFKLEKAANKSGVNRWYIEFEEISEKEKGKKRVKNGQGAA